MTQEVQQGKPDAQQQKESLGEHEQKMVELADKGTLEGEVQKKADAQAKEGQAGPRPSWLPPKFKTVEDYVKSYNELETKLGEQGAKSEEGQLADQDTVPSESQGEEGKEGEGEGDAGNKAELSLDEYYEEFTTNGQLSDESYEKLGKVGFSKDIVDTYIQGYQAQVNAIRQEAYNLVGGEEDYTAMEAWASKTLSETEQEAFNKQLEGDKTQWELAIRGLHAKYLQSGDAPVERVRSGKTPPQEGIQPITSQEELTTLMTTKEYKTSPEFRKKVKDRLTVSDNAALGAFIPEHKYASHG